MDPGDELVLRATEERVRVVAVLDAAGTLLVQPADGEPFEVARDDVERPWAKHQGCACCG